MDDRETLDIQIDPRMRPFRVALKDIGKLSDPMWSFGTALLAAAAECGCQDRRCQNLTAAEDKETGTLEVTHGEGLRSWPASAWGTGVVLSLIDWFSAIHAYEDTMARSRSG